LKPSALRKVQNGSLRILPFEEIDRKVKAGEYQAHHFDDLLVLTQVMQYEKEKILEVVLLLGEGFLEKKSEVVAHLVSFAKENGCQAVEALSRKGLGPTLKSLGFRTTRVLLRRDLA
jgi:hypothetical protein